MKNKIKSYINKNQKLIKENKDLNKLKRKPGRPKKSDNDINVIKPRRIIRVIKN
jgi:hypothetical protein